MIAIEERPTCLWCGRDLEDPDEVFCGEPCRHMWWTDDQI